MKTKWLVLLTLTLAVQGKVVSFNAKWVEIKDADGRRQYVPRQAIVDKSALEENSVVTARFTLEELAAAADSWPGGKTVMREPTQTKLRK